MAAAYSINAACFAATAASLFAFNFASLARWLAFSTERRWIPNAHSLLVNPFSRSLALDIHATLFFTGAGLVARASAANVRGTTYYLVFMVVQWSKATACMGEMAELEPREKGNKVI
jgi:hypothetical protein